jgi:signal transduction histidine kinase
VVFSAILLLGNLGLAVYIHLVLAFPSGHVRSTFDRRLVGFGYGYLVAAGIVGTLLGATWAVENVRNVFAVAQAPDVAGAVDRLEAIIGVVVCVLVPYRAWRHWRDASPAGRRVLFPVVVSSPLMFASIAIANFAFAFEPASFLGLAVPDEARSAWDVVTFPVQFVIPLGFLVGTLRARLGRGRVADLVIELGQGVPPGQLRDVLARALGDRTLEVAFPSPDGIGFVDAQGRPIEVTNGPDRGTTGATTRATTRLEHDGELVAVLIHDPAIDDESPGLVEAVAASARLALENERLTAQVRAQLEEVRESRARVITAADAERARVERDLHDGAQQRLVALAMRLQVAKATTPEASALLDEATAELEAAIGEVRQLARGLHPTILTEAGLAAAVEALVERTPVDVSVDVSVDVAERRYPGPVEATAYFVIAEALTNVARHAPACQARVTVREEPGQLVIVVADDGPGGADPTAGTGLMGLTDRVAAIGGRLDVSSPASGGTTLRAVVPTG